MNAHARHWAMLLAKSTVGNIVPNQQSIHQIWLHYDFSLIPYLKTSLPGKMFVHK